MRNTRQKDIVLEALCEYEVHPTADELFQYIHKKHADVGIATVYRNLNKLSMSGRIRKISGLDGAFHYDYKTEPHFHFVCNCCGRIHDILEDIGIDLIKRAESVADCKITSLELTFRGLCRECEAHSASKCEEDG